MAPTIAERTKSGFEEPRRLPLPTFGRAVLSYKPAEPAPFKETRRGFLGKDDVCKPFGYANIAWPGAVLAMPAQGGSERMTAGAGRGSAAGGHTGLGLAQSKSRVLP